MRKGMAILTFLVLGSAAHAAATPGTPGSPLGAGPPPDYLPCDAAGLGGEIDANTKALSALETQIRTLEVRRGATRTQMLSLNPADQAAMMQRSALQRQFDNDAGRIAMLEANANTMRDHIARLQQQRAACGPGAQTASP